MTHVKESNEEIFIKLGKHIYVNHIKKIANQRGQPNYLFYSMCCPPNALFHIRRIQIKIILSERKSMKGYAGSEQATYKGSSPRAGQGSGCSRFMGKFRVAGAAEDAKLPFG